MKAYAMTDRGRKRQINQDAVYYSTFPVGNIPNLFVVADGMGGHQAGDFASKYTIDNLVRLIEAAEGNNPITILNDSIRQVNGMLLERASEDEKLAGMGTTLVAACVMGSVLCVANVGDSRLYVIQDEIRQITRDHSLVEELIQRGEMERGSEAYHEHKNIITRAIGARSGVFADFFEVTLEEGDTVLMCSDGLSNMVPDDTIREIVAGREDLKAAAEDLIEEANNNGGRDNIAVVLFRPNVDEVKEW
ncbi:Stp1/IreP family PP2C-type Ser/Thr phosphatase [Qiania dongpingensis]|uniref:Stp1/IreP family PP2C-type Ser/Thr phosphatase n=1 Tax=Qiania dongpingensis TaxID=2763669 RepID=A0A7G9G5U1_9FIRM|nr:Stp1/IreP family PP2C-type Ser/Thr phosphatase [Qiania dongpingensis]QNM06173.1 Stp1/IreP family PP2C-type Ser/Thr phosphatase [Qiania dongpingensis]